MRPRRAVSSQYKASTVYKYNVVPVSVRLSQFRPSALAGPVRRTWVRVLTPKPSRVKSEPADGAE